MTKKEKPILFSGIQPTGEIHIGNYFGALKNWVDLQNSGKYNCLYSVVDLHAITIDYDTKNYQNKILNTALDLLAIGINPKKAILFVQSQVTEHTELCWLFNTLIPVAELERMTQFKDKSRQNEKNINMGLFDYPALMAADILLYKSAVVPVGQDQFQHLELTNLVVKKFNNKYGKYFSEVKTLVSPVPRLMSLTDPTKKMSKSHGPASYIALTDSPDIIKNKIQKAVTAGGYSLEYISKIENFENIPIKINKDISVENTKPENINPKNVGSTNSIMAVYNLLFLLKLFTDKKTFDKFEKDRRKNKLKFSELKPALAEAIINYLKPIQEKRKYFADNKIKVKKILEDGAKKARIIAQKNILEIKKKMGLN